MTVNLAVVGAGYWGPNLIRNFAGLDECRLLAVCDLDETRLKSVAERFGIHTTSKLEEILVDPELLGVAVATPAESHAAIVAACLKAGKHVFVEKPLAAGSREAEALVDLARERSLILMVGHLFLYDTAISRLLELIRQGSIGQIRYAHGIRTSMAGTARLDTNIIWDALIHDAYILPALFGRAPQRVLAVGQGYLNPELEDVAFVSFDFGDGALAQVYVSWYALEKARKITVIGSEAILHYNDLEEPRLILYDRRYEQGADLDPFGRPHWHWRDNGGKAVVVAQAEPLKAECQHFLDCVATGKLPMTDGAAGLAAVRLIEACQRSVKAGGNWVEVG
jgi:predicted dehydrogenase